MSEKQSWLKSKFTMQRLNCEFVDKVSGKEVFKYVDCYGNYWLANRNHWFFRVPSKGVTQ